MAKRKLSRAARKAISIAARARWAKYRQDKGLGSPIRLGGRPGRKPKAGGKRRGRPPGSRNVSSSSVPTLGGGFDGQATGSLIALRRKIDQELADRMVRDYVG